MRAGAAGSAELQFFLDETDEVGGRFVDAQHAGIDAEVVGGGGAPRARAVEVVIVGPALVPRLYFLLGLFGGDVVEVAHAAHAVVHVGGDEDVDAARLVAQDVVGAAADEDTRMVVGRLTDGFALYAEERLVADLVVVEVALAQEGEEAAEDRAEKALALVALFEDFGAEPALFGGYGEYLLVVVGNFEIVGQQVPDGAPAAAELAAYVDDERFGVHGSDGFSCSLSVGIPQDGAVHFSFKLAHLYDEHHDGQDAGQGVRRRHGIPHAEHGVVEEVGHDEQRR